MTIRYEIIIENDYYYIDNTILENIKELNLNNTLKKIFR